MPPNLEPFWTGDKISRLTQLAAEKLPSSQIADKLGCTRNSVIGKCHRLGIKLHHTCSVNKLPKKEQEPMHKTLTHAPIPLVAFDAIPETKIAPDANVRTYGPVLLIDARADQCRYISFGQTICGEKVAAGHSWCPSHIRSVFTQN